MTDHKDLITDMGAKARAGFALLASASDTDKATALLASAKALRAKQIDILAANAKDMDGGREHGLSDAMLDRLMIDEQRLEGIAAAVENVAVLPDPVGAVIDRNEQPNGLVMERIRVPLGVIGIVYESRPNVTADAAALCLRSGNAVILRGGSEALHSNQAIAACIRRGLADASLPESAVQVLDTTDRAAVGALITKPEYVDVIVPRGGKGLIERISAESTVAVIKHLDGNCHVYIDDGADQAMAVAIAVNAKTQRYGTCNTMETLLVAESMAASVLPELAEKFREKGVELRGCARTRALIEALEASEDDWYEEYLAPILAIKVVADVDEAIAHINRYSSQHTESIVTRDYQRGRRFIREVDSSSVMINTSTRFADGFEYGLGAEIGISTDKIHARGPVGLDGLTSEKYVVLGSGQVRN